MVSPVIDVVGIGEDGWAGLGPAQRDLVAFADVVLGGERHLALVADHRPLAADARPWPSALRAALPALLADLDGHRVVALASGDPMRSGIGTTLVELLGADAVRVHPAVSSVALARARQGWSAESVEVVTVVGRDLRTVRPVLAPRARLVVLCSDGDGPRTLGELLASDGWGASTITARWHLGGRDEGARSATAAEWAGDGATTPDLVLACVEVRADAVPPDVGPVPGRGEAAFDHDGQISKRDARASALARLRPTAGARLWDLGAGSGAVGLEWCLAAPRATCTSIERDPARAERIRANADRLGVSDRLTVVVRDHIADGALADLPDPDAVFVGGGVDDDAISEAWQRLPAGGRLVAHAVTLESESVLVALSDRLDGELTRLSVEHAKPLGRYLGWTPLRPVVQLAARKDPS